MKKAPSASQHTRTLLDDLRASFIKRVHARLMRCDIVYEDFEFRKFYFQNLRIASHLEKEIRVKICTTCTQALLYFDVLRQSLCLHFLGSYQLESFQGENIYNSNARPLHKFSGLKLGKFLLYEYQNNVDSRSQCSEYPGLNQLQKRPRAAGRA